MPQTPGQTEMLEAQLFELAPVSLWLQDLGALKARLDAWREAGMVDLRAWLRDPGHLRTCQSLIRIVRVNRSTLAIYDARDEAELFAHIPAIFDDPCQRGQSLHSVQSLMEFLVAESKEQPERPRTPLHPIAHSRVGLSAIGPCRIGCSVIASPPHVVLRTK